MNLEQYLTELKNCPNDKLTLKLGVYDNYPVVLELDYDVAKSKLSKILKLNFVRESNLFVRVSEFKYDDNIHVLRLKNSRYAMYFLDKKTQNKIDGRKFNSFFFLHPYQNESAFDKQKEMADMIIYLSEEFFIKQKISVFFPASCGNSKDPEKLVFYEPEESK